MEAKVVLLGEGYVGKTSILLRYIEDKFSDYPDGLLGSDYWRQKSLNIDGHQMLLRIGDTQRYLDRFREIDDPYDIRNICGAIVVYDITDKDSFLSCDEWVHGTYQYHYYSGNIVLCIVGNKIDLEMNRTVSQKEAEDYAASVGAVHYHTSTKRNEGIQELFWDLSERILHAEGLATIPRLVVNPQQAVPIRNIDRDLFEEAMQSGYVLCNLVILLLIGVAGSGKTCFSQVVLDKPPPAVRESTPLAQAAIRAVSTSRATVSDKGSAWQIVSSTGLQNMLAGVIKGKTIHHLPASPLSHPNPGTFTKVLKIFRRPKSQAAKSQPLDGTAEKLATKSRPSFEKLAESSPVQHVISHMSAAEPTSKEVFSENWVYLTDSGGQPQFHELIPTFMHHVSGAALFVKLNEDLSSHPVIGYYESGELCGTTYSSSLTHEQTIKNCLQMMQSRLNISGDNNCPALFFVGTHRDLESASRESIENKDGQILDMIKSLKGLKEHVVFNRVAKPKRVMYVLNTQNPDDEDRQTVAEFRKAVMNGCKKIELKIPLSWFIFEQQIQELAQKKSELVLSLDECLKVACDLEMDKARLLAALDYFVRLNLFKFFPQVLPNVVFTSSQVLLDKISELVAYSHYLGGRSDTRPSSAQSENDSNSLRFTEHAIVNVTFLKRFSSHYRYTDNLFTPHELLDLLSNQLVFAPLTGEDFFMPCVLPHLPLDEVSSYRLPSTSPVAPMLIYYAGGLFSTGLFSALVAFLQDRSPWKVAEKNSEPICLFKNCVMFRHTDFPITLTLIYSFEFIEIHVQVQQGFSPEPYVSVRTTLLLGLDRAAKIQGCNNLSPKVGFFCPCGNESPHLATASDDGKWWFCSIDDTCSGLLTEKYYTWLSDYCDLQDSLGSSTVNKASKETPSTASGMPSHYAPSSGTLEEKPTLKQLQHASTVTALEFERTSKQLLNGQPPSSVALEDKPTLKQLQVLTGRDGRRVRVMDSVASKWEHLAIALEFEATDIDRVKRNNVQDVDGACRDIFTKWLNGESECNSPITWHTLIQSLIDAGLVAVAEDLQEILPVQ